MILSCVRCNADGDCGFQDQKRINVAITRSKTGLIVIGNSDTLQYSSTWNQFITSLRDVNAYRVYESVSDDKHRLAELDSHSQHLVAEPSDCEGKTIQQFSSDDVI